MQTKEQLHVEMMNLVLSDTFGVKPCPIKWTWGRNRGGSFIFNRFTRWHLMRLSKHAWRGHDSTFAHEYAHYLCFLNNEWDHHGPKFRKRLLQVVKIYFTDIKDYSWGTEYSRIQTWYSKGIK